MDDRKTGIGGSDVGSIVGCRGAYSTPWRAWAEKSGLREPDPMNEAMEMGHLMEPTILRLYEERTENRLLLGVVLPDDKLWWRDTTLRHPTLAWAMANMDGICKVDGDYVVVDAKNTQRRGLGDDEDVADVDEGKVPEQWWLQLHHYAWILRAWGLSVADSAHIACLINGSEYRTLVVPLDLDWYEAKIVPQLADFWACVGEKREPPGLAIQPERTPLPVVDAGDAARRYLEAARDEKAAKEAKALAQSELWAALDAVGLPARATCDGAKLSASRVEGRVTINPDALKETHPDAYVMHARAGDPYRTLRVTETKT